MDEFKPKKGKALMRSVAQEANQRAEKAVELLADKWPQGAVALGILQSSFGLMLAYKQEILNQFTEHMMQHPEVYTPKELSSPEFLDGLVVALGSYFRLRSEEKRELAQRIFYDFGKSTEKPLYPLERYDDTLEKISQSGIRLLGFISTEIPLVKQRYVAAKLHQNSNATDKENVKRMTKAYTNGKSLSSWVEEYVKETAERATPRRNGELWVADLEKHKARIRNEIVSGISELEQLGLVRDYHRSGGWGGGEDGYNLTDYGEKFITVIMPPKAHQ